MQKGNPQPTCWEKLLFAAPDILLMLRNLNYNSQAGEVTVGKPVENRCLTHSHHFVYLDINKWNLRILGENLFCSSTLGAAVGPGEGHR